MRVVITKQGTAEVAARSVRGCPEVTSLEGSDASTPQRTHSDAIHRKHFGRTSEWVGHHPLDYSHPRSLKAERSTPGGAYHPPEP